MERAGRRVTGTPPGRRTERRWPSVPLPMIRRLALADELRAPAFEFEPEILLLAQHLLQLVLRPVELRPQRRGPIGVFLAPEPRQPGRLRAPVPRPLLPLLRARGYYFHELVQGRDTFEFRHKASLLHGQRCRGRAERAPDFDDDGQRIPRRRAAGERWEE